MEGISLKDIVEVVTGGAPRANYFLAHGYILLEIHSSANLKDGGDGRRYIRKGTIFVLGRTANIPHVEQPWDPGEKETSESKRSGD